MQAALIPQASPDAYGITNVLPRSATALACPTGVMAGELQQDHCSWMGGEMVKFGKSAAVRAPRLCQQSRDMSGASIFFVLDSLKVCLHAVLARRSTFGCSLPSGPQHP